MTRERYGDAWVCQDCYFAHHYGAHVEDFDPDELGLDPAAGYGEAGDVVQLWFAGEDDEPVGGWYEIRHNRSLQHNREPLWALREFELADNTCSNHNGDDEQGCSECGVKGWEDGIQDFSWSSCDGCHSPLGGSRYRLSLWKEEP